MKFLATNDDGIEAPGLALLARALSRLGQVTVVAPVDESSGCGHQVTSRFPLTVTNVGPGRHMVDGTPADCVRLGLLHLAPDTDWVVAGVNSGGNLGVDIHMSGTVAAAREAALFGKPAVALSRYRRNKGPVDWDAVFPQVQSVIEHLQSHPWKPGVFWNVNFPDLEDGSANPEVVACPLEAAHLLFRYELQQGKHHFHGNYHERPRKSGSDVDVCFSGKIAVTQLTAG